jgi:hypothetical protein
LLTPDEKEQIAALVDQLVARPGVGEAEAFELLRALPERPEALALARELVASRQGALAGALEMAIARLRSLFAADEVARPVEAVPAGAGDAAEALGRLLEAAVPYPAKVDALLGAIRHDERRVAPVLRARIAVESNPFVLATLASALGHLGEPADGALLRPLLDSTDARVVANALDAYTRLKADAPLAQVRELVGAADHRLRLSALGLIARSDPAAVLALVPALIKERAAPFASGLAMLLGNLGDSPRATELLLEMLALEDRTQVLKHVAQSLKRHATPERAPAILGPLELQRAAAGGAKQAMLGALHSEIAALAPAPAPTGMRHTPPQGFRAVDPKSIVTTAAYGTPRPPGLVSPNQPSGAVTAPPPSAEPAPPRMGWTGGAVAAGLLVLVAVGPGRAPAPTAAARAVTRHAGDEHAAPASAVTAPAARSLTARSAAADPFARPAPKHLGPAGSEVLIEGTVITVGQKRVIVRCGDRFYTLRGKGLDDVKPGDAIKRSGKVSGVASDGMIFVAVTG